MRSTRNCTRRPYAPPRKNQASARFGSRAVHCSIDAMTRVDRRAELARRATCSTGSSWIRHQRAVARSSSHACGRRRAARPRRLGLGVVEARVEDRVVHARAGPASRAACRARPGESRRRAGRRTDEGCDRPRRGPRAAERMPRSWRSRIGRAKRLLAGVALERQFDQAVEHRRVAECPSLPTASGTC